MLVYHFTNDTRFENLKENLIAVANHLENDEWNMPGGQALDSAKNGWYPVYTQYFGLYKGSENSLLIIEGKIIKVITEFVKKFQFPNPRKIKTVNAMSLEIENGQKNAPLRHLIKLMFYKAQVEARNRIEITIDNFERYILFNEEVARNNITLEQNYAQMEDNSLLNHNFDYEYYGGNEDRFVNQLLGIASHLSFLKIEKQMIILDLTSLTDEDKINLFDIVTYNDYWIPRNSEPKDNINSYQEYLQVSTSKTSKVQYILNEDNNSKDIDERMERYQLEDIHNLIYYGAPGTGKSYGITKKIKVNYPNFEDLTSPDYFSVFRTTLHPEYTYSDFVGQIMPVLTDEGPEYKFSPSIFTLALKKALEFEKINQPIYLILEELSRANVAAVFGDLFQLLDRKEGKSEYSISNPLISKFIYGYSDSDLETGKVNSKIYLPSNLYIYASVNTNDQNVFVMDTAFKRRFDWIYVSTKPVDSKNNPILNITNSKNEVGTISWHELYQNINQYITKVMKLGEDKQVGQFFINFSEDKNKNMDKIKNKLLQYLWDDVERSSFNGTNLFSRDMTSFSDLYENFEKRNCIFSEEFMKTVIENINYNDSSIKKVGLEED